MRRFRSEFITLGTALQGKIQIKVEEHLDIIMGILDIIRSDIVVKDSEMDLGFRTRVAEEIRSLEATMEGIRIIVGNDS